MKLWLSVVEYCQPAEDDPLNPSCDVELIDWFTLTPAKADAANCADT